MTSLIVPLIGTVLDPLMPIAAVAALVFLMASLAALQQRRAAASLVRFALFCAFGWVSLSNVPRGPDRSESSAIGDCRSVYSTETAYASANNGAFGLPSCLATPSSCGWPSEMTVLFLGPELASLQPKGGYSRSFVPGPPGNGKPDRGIATFVYVAVPVKRGGKTVRGFAIDQTGLLCFTDDGSIPLIVDAALSSKCSHVQ